MASWRLACLGASTALAACSLVVDTSGLSGGRDQPLDAGESDATRDADDDGAKATDGSSVRFCEREKHAFCADFDGTDPFEGWTYFDRGLDDAGIGVSSKALSPPLAFQAVLPRRDKQTVYASLSKDLRMPWRALRVEFDFFVEPLAFLPGDSTTGLFCAGFYAGQAVEGVCTSVSEAAYGEIRKPLPTNVWTHARYDIDPDAKNATVTLGGEVYSEAFILPTGTGERAMLIQFGVLGYNVPAPTFTAYFDNITIDFP